ncbi:hypothetical protein BDN72DRAFT_906571 [Pluteus cervinus]|uniref:Uncharacterized protein n=2 Tax=Pluteus cervinus TaxID=181527 RepID=A0ACD2ZYH8_9AGAR|nr:hypothetical protein BDN72DRAFT_906667 [Pluteus cervinus]TFK58623.1 hypothetical protein BDN72DRAFT_906571 [Pluteus cervinus]
MPPTASTMRYARKRQREGGSDSEVEIVDSSVQAKPKSGDGETSKTNEAPGGRPIRERKPSTKARQIAEDGFNPSTTFVSTATASAPKNHTESLVLKALDAPKFVDQTGAISDSDELPAPGSVLKKDVKNVTSAKDGDSDDEPLVSPRKIVKTTAILKSAVNKKIYESAQPGVLNGEGVNVPASTVDKGKGKSTELGRDVMASRMAEKMFSVIAETEQVVSVASDIERRVAHSSSILTCHLFLSFCSVHDDDDMDSVDLVAGPVTDQEYQHPQLYDLYEGLPFIRKLAQVVSYQLNPDDEVPIGTVPMDRLFRNTSLEDLTCIFRGLSFKRYGRHVNMARAVLNIHRVEVVKMPNGSKVHRAMLVSMEEHPVYWMIAGVAESYLIRTSTSFGKAVHGIKVGMLRQEGRREFSVWGKVFGFRTRIGPVDKEGFLSLNTRTEFKPAEGSSGSAPSSPSKSSRVFKVTYGPRVSGKTASPPKKKTPTAKDFPFERYFEDRVPVYNGIASQESPFNFSDAEFDRLPTRRLWEGNLNGEIPEGSIVAVGYTLHVWGDDQQYISPNLVSIVMLHEAA